ncbi:hypothetical protein [Shewanella algae]|uniref:hypothetical protein n=1 Tax=Shewanella algae TaxID=38313 RepID=UPI0031F4B1ED
MTDTTYQFANYLAVFIDLLGHRDLYDKIAEIPPDGSEELSEFTSNVVEFIRSIEYLSKDVENYFTGHDSHESDLPWPEELAEFRAKMKNRICKVQRFSDGLVIFVPLKNDETHFPIGSVYKALGAAAMLILGSLAKGSPVRGGIAIGGGIELTDGELFGPVVGRAYEAESKIAQYPRIVVHPSVAKYVETHAAICDPKTNEEKYLKLMGSICSEMISHDVDGVQVLHYLGDVLWGGILSNGGLPLLKKAREFAATQLLIYQNEGNSKLAIRYLLLNSYLTGNGPEASGEQ